MEALSIKLRIDGSSEVRRHTILPSDTFAALTAHLSTLLQATVVALTYEDDQGDRIVVSTDADLDEARRFARDNAVQTLVVHARVRAPPQLYPSVPTAQPSASTSQQSPSAAQPSAVPSPQSTVPPPQQTTVPPAQESTQPSAPAAAPESTASHPFGAQQTPIEVLDGLQQVLNFIRTVHQHGLPAAGPFAPFGVRRFGPPPLLFVFGRVVRAVFASIIALWLFGGPVFSIARHSFLLVFPFVAIAWNIFLLWAGIAIIRRLVSGGRPFRCGGAAGGRAYCHQPTQPSQFVHPHPQPGQFVHPHPQPPHHAFGVPFFRGQPFF